MSKNGRTRGFWEGDKHYWFDFDAFRDAIKAKKPIKEDSRHNPLRIADAEILREIENEISVPYDTLKKWKTGDHAPSDLNMIIDLANYFEMDDYHDLLIEDKNKMVGDEHVDIQAKLEETIKETLISLITDPSGLVKQVSDNKTVLGMTSPEVAPEKTTEEENAISEKNTSDGQMVVANKLSSHEIELIGYVFGQLVEIEELVQNGINPSQWSEEEINRFFADKDNKIQKLSEETIKKIDKSALLASNTVRNRLYRLVIECREDDPEGRWDKIAGIPDTICGSYWNIDDRDYFIEKYPDDAWWYINMENEWLDDMGIDDFKSIDDEHYKLVDAYYAARANHASEEELNRIMGEIKSYGSASVAKHGIDMTPREVIRHDFCKDLIKVFKHDFPELELEELE